MILHLSSLNNIQYSESKQRLVIGDKGSNTKEVKYGAPQGSVLRAIIFQIYMSVHLEDLIKEHELEYHIYADDNTSIYCLMLDSARAKLNIEKSFTIIKDSLLENRMKLNDGKQFPLMETFNKKSM